MKNQNYFIIILTTLISVNTLHSQSKGNIYTSSRDSLTARKIYFQQEVKNYKSQIDSLNQLSIYLDESINRILKEIDDLYIGKFGKENASRILNKQVWKGMSDKMLHASWGKPDRIDTNKERWGLFTQWYYGDVIFFFRDHKLTDWEETKNKEN